MAAAASLEDVVAAFDIWWLSEHLGVEPPCATVPVHLRNGAARLGEGWVAPVRLALASRGLMFATGFDDEYSCFRQ